MLITWVTLTSIATLGFAASYPTVRAHAKCDIPTAEVDDAVLRSPHGV
jgi:hypothetical protein